MKTARPPRRAPRRSGFTLIELLVVVAIIGILAALLSSAILQLTKTAVDKRNANNAERLRAAIVEYWHDMGRWPLPAGAKPTLKKGSGEGLAGSAQEGQKIDTYSYTVSFTENNSAVVANLLNATLPNGTKKTFLDLHGFSTPADSENPTDNVVDAWLAYEDKATDKYRRPFSTKTPVLVYFSPFVKCPKCDTYYAATGSRTFCTNPDCEQVKNTGRKYRFTKSEKRHPVQLAQPFTISFDLFNNVVEVSTK